MSFPEAAAGVRNGRRVAWRNVYYHASRMYWVCRIRFLISCLRSRLQFFWESCLPVSLPLLYWFRYFSRKDSEPDIMQDSRRGILG